MAQIKRLGRRWASAPLLVLLALACNETPDRPPPSSGTDIDLTDLVHYDTTTADTRDVYATGACTEGATRECRVYLPSHNEVQPCFVGEQSCSAGAWSECASGVLVDANDDDAEIDPDDIGK